MTEHSPGPWATVDGRIVFAGGWTLNPVANCEFTHPYGLVTIAERKANAHLIAAAPDMLAALVAIRECTFVDPARPLSTPCQDCMDMVNAAIAKAKGGTMPYGMTPNQMAATVS